MTARHPVTGRFMSGDCERDCEEHCAGLCGNWNEAPSDVDPVRYRKIYDPRGTVRYGPPNV
jgi:hypothetical protein